MANCTMLLSQSWVLLECAAASSSPIWMAWESFHCFSVIGSLGYCFFPRKVRLCCAMNVILHQARGRLQCFERPRSVQHIGRTRFRSPCIIMKRPRWFSLSTGSYSRFVGSQYRKAAHTNMRHVSAKHGELYDATTLIMSITSMWRFK